jgi:hypothetical protein
LTTLSAFVRIEARNKADGGSSTILEASAILLGGLSRVRLCECSLRSLFHCLIYRRPSVVDSSSSHQAGITKMLSICRCRRCNRNPSSFTIVSHATASFPRHEYSLSVRVVSVRSGSWIWPVHRLVQQVSKTVHNAEGTYTFIIIDTYRDGIPIRADACRAGRHRMQSAMARMRRRPV